jgi:hypothetical protein
MTQAPPENTGGPAVAARFVPKRRTSFPLWARVPSLALAYCVGAPITKTLEVFGQWPSLLTKMGRPPPISRGFEDYVPSAHDVIACSYFKSGTNLLLQMAVQIANRGHAEFDHIHDVVPWAESPFDGYAIPVEDETPWRESPTGLRLIKTHKPAAGVPLSDAAKYIVIIRDPKSVLVSGYLFSKALMFGPMMPSINNYADLFMSPRFPFGPWPEHVAGYWALRSRPNVLIMTYEEMIKDLGTTVRCIADFVNVALSTEELQTIERQSSFAYMKEIARKFDFIKFAPWSKQEGAAIRKGQPNNSRELLSRALQQRVDDHCRNELKRLGCDFPYDEAFATRS